MKKAIVLVNVGFGEYNGADRQRELQDLTKTRPVKFLRLPIQIC
jgi:hypothetical protein